MKAEGESADIGLIAAAGANILTAQHDRLSAGLDPNEANAHTACEVGGERLFNTCASRAK